MRDEVVRLTKKKALQNVATFSHRLLNAHAAAAADFVAVVAKIHAANMRIIKNSSAGRCMRYVTCNIQQ